MLTKVYFTLPAVYVSGATEGYLLGEFNAWNPQDAVVLQKIEDGSMKAELKLEAGKSYQYRYLLNDGRWVNDGNTTILSDVHGNTIENCIVHVPAEEIKTVSPKKSAKGTVSKSRKEKPQSDDLTKIEGVGKKIAKLLNEAGIFTYKDLSKSTIKNLKTLLNNAGKTYAVHEPKSWPKQAKLAAENKWVELGALQQTLKGGKE
ncbi:MAG TPA: helix-hairpin-helix domain-containing protein [Ferruginibacter sp.]|nr:glycoside hydrolase family 13 [Bacteroidota bacterium]MBS1925778.1 glycoside hydrolase family 13 [Bacteroidota bacterium]MCC6692734.1 glycoside hydrolase family 13 [Chitinophagaceae bacterium]HMT96941.1 helix-hairpin-helix domain-containing protein [Ferruginibacter sp.]HMU24997.1 helix-hairpin-helix domain-containing protein [Ferruginibacter sp.]